MKSMGKILVIHGSDFSRKHIVKVDITEQVEKIEDNQTPTSYSSSTVSVNNLSLKIMINNNDCSK